MLDLLPVKRRRGREVQVPSVFREMEDMFKRFWEDMPLAELATDLNIDWTPRLDISETEDAIEVKAELPGLEKDDIEISLDRDTLIIRGEKKQEHEEQDKKFHRIERSYGSFYRAVRLPAEVEADKVDASYKRGVLTVKLPKTEESRKRVARIKVH